MARLGCPQRQSSCVRSSVEGLRIVCCYNMTMPRIVTLLLATLQDKMRHQALHARRHSTGRPRSPPWTLLSLLPATRSVMLCRGHVETVILPIHLSNGNRHDDSAAQSNIGGHFRCTSSISSPQLPQLMAYGSSQGGRQGWVRSWVMNGSATLLLLNMAGNRWCGNMEREHRSNGIFYVADLTVWGSLIFCVRMLLARRSGETNPVAILVC